MPRDSRVGEFQDLGFRVQGSGKTVSSRWSLLSRDAQRSVSSGVFRRFVTVRQDALSDSPPFGGPLKGHMKWLLT